MNSARLLAARKRAVGGAGWKADLFPKQRAFLEDPSKVKAAIAGRRGGKTWAAAAGLYEAARKHPLSLNPYVCLSAVSARRIMWPVLKAFNARYGLGMKLRDHELVAELPENGAQIFCVGGDDLRKVEALRGGKYARVVIDEAGSFGRQLLRYLCDDVLDAALLDLDGDMWLTGSPNAACVGHFYDITTGANPKVAKVSTHHWNVLDNTHIPHAEAWLARKRADKHWGIDNPVYRREYLGHWVRDTSSLVFRFDRARHLVHVAPEGLRSVLGVDVGASKVEATTAFVANGWAKHNRTVYTQYAKKHVAMAPEDGANEAKRIMTLTGAGLAVVDAGSWTGYVDEWRNRFGVNAIPAEKKRKMAFVEILNGELDAGRLLLLDNGDTQPLIEELELLQWDEDRKDYDDRFADHGADAWLYSWRDCYAWAEGSAPNTGPAFGSVEYLQALAHREKQQAMKDAVRRDRRNRPMW